MIGLIEHSVLNFYEKLTFVYVHMIDYINMVEEILTQQYRQYYWKRWDVRTF